jgi:protein O-mannosyl-transferase
VNNTQTKIIICVFLVLATFCIYSPVQNHHFINFDDDFYITNNINVQAGLTSKSFTWAFTTSHFANWHPVTWLSHILDYQLYGLHAKGHHLTSLFFHIANVLILFIVFSRMTGELWRSGFVAAMFAFHPLNIESVAWIAERKNVLSTLFLLLTMWAYIHYIKKPSIKSYSLVILFFVLGLMTKPMLVTLPFVLLLLDYWPLRRFKFPQERDSSVHLDKNIAKNSEFLPLVLEKIPLFLLTIAASIVTFIVQKSGGALHAMETISLSARINNAMISYVKYLKKMLWPEKLAIIYPHPGNTISVWEGVLCGIVLLGITIISIRLVRKAPYFAVGWFWYLGTLVPVIQVVQTGAHSMADRYAYVPLIGMFIIIVWGIPELISNWRHKEKVLFASGGIIILALLATTANQLSHWKNSITIFQHAIEVTNKKYPDSGIAYNNLAIALFSEKKIKEAIYNLKMAIQLRHNDFKAHQNLGVALFTDQKIREAIYHYNKAIMLNPNYAKSYFNLGKAQIQQGEIKKAIHNFRKTLNLKPDHAKAKNSLKLALLRWQEIQ